MRVPFRLGWVAVAAAAVLLAACGSSTSSSEEPETPAAAPAATSGAASTPAAAFPVTVKHAFGETTIESEPKRIIAVGWISPDVVAALGVVPVAISDFTWGEVGPMLPWFEKKVTELGGEKPEILKTNEAGELDIEQVLSLDPDVVLAPHSGLTEKEYKALSDRGIPTVGYKDIAWTSEWRDVTRTVGTVMGKTAEAEQLVTDSDALLADLAAKHPEFAGKTFAYGWAMYDGEPGLGFYTTKDARNLIVEQLGLTPAAKIKSLTDTAQEFIVYVSLEELDGVEADVYVAWADDQSHIDAMTKNKLVSRWAPIADQRSFIMTDHAIAWATSAPSPLSIAEGMPALADGISQAIAS